MPATRAFCLAAALGAVAALGEPLAGDAGIPSEAFELGDECLASSAGGNSPQCAFSALQKKAREGHTSSQPEPASWPWWPEWLKRPAPAPWNPEPEPKPAPLPPAPAPAPWNPEPTPAPLPPAPAPLPPSPEPLPPEPQPVPLPPRPQPIPEAPSANEPGTDAPKATNLNPIVIKGPYLYDSVTGKRFFAKGVAYNPRNTVYNEDWGKTDECSPGNPKRVQTNYAEDVIVDDLEDEWAPALKAIADLGANTIRVYNIDPEKSHDKFMEAAANYGIYVIIPLTRQDWGYLPAFPSPDCYSKEIEGYGNVGVNLLTSGKLIVKTFSRYNNVLMFTAANEMVVNDQDGYSAFPCVKAFTRDIHNYQKSCSHSMRRVPLIYSGMDMGAPTRTEIGQYLTCNLESEDDAVDAYGINVYSWCDNEYIDDHGKDNFNWSPYFNLNKDFKTFSKPMLFSEFGCNTGAFETKCPYKGGRTWVQFKSIVEKMGGVFSGAIAFEFSMEKNEFGLALTPGFLEGQDRIKLLDNYYALQKMFHKYNISDEWDATSADVTSCSWRPSHTGLRKVSTCQLNRAASIQKSRGTHQVVSWAELPPTPRAPLSDVNGQAECPSDIVPAAAYKEGCCRQKC